MGGQPGCRLLPAPRREAAGAWAWAPIIEGWQQPSTQLLGEQTLQAPPKPARCRPPACTHPRRSYALLHVPSLLPFIATGSLTLLLLRGNIPPGGRWTEPYAKSWAKCRGVANAMLSALVLVALMM